jgi:hypothetical protein
LLLIESVKGNVIEKENENGNYPTSEELLNYTKDPL